MACHSQTTHIENSRRHLTVQDVLQRLDDSELDLSTSDDTGDEIVYPLGADHLSKESNDIDLDDELDEDESLVEQEQPSTSRSQTESNTNAKSKKTDFKWRSPREAFNPGNSEWQEDFSLGNGFVSPSMYFLQYFKPEIFYRFAEQTNIYYMLKTGKSLGTTATEMQKFFGITIVMANLGFPRICMYWQRATRVNAVADVMPVNRYLQIRNSIHINAEQNPPLGTNKFWKIQPLIDAVRSRCLELPREEFNSVDEQMIPFTGRVPAKQFIKSKPNPVGVKNFVICGKSGRAIDFELYQGAGTGVPEATKFLGLGASIVLRLCETVPQNKNYKLCFDNYFTGMDLIRELKKLGIQSLGVVKANRLKGCLLKSEKELRKDGRGSTDCKVSVEGDICVVRWMDNGAVTLASSFVGIEEVDTVRRWCESKKEFIQVDRPKCVQVYNENMGGVDKMDFLISLYRIKAKTKKWPVRMFFHFMDFALVNAWLEYRDIEIRNGIPTKNIWDLLCFRNEVASVLVKAHLTTSNPCRPVGRPRTSITPVIDSGDEPKTPTTSLAATSTPAKRARPTERPAAEVRYDRFGHFSICIKELGQRCKLEGCKGRSRFKCTKCNLFLSCTSDKNCFKKFHTR